MRALLKLYLKEPESRAMTAWRKKIGDPLLVTHHGRVELTNGIGLAACRGMITDKIHDAAMVALDDDLHWLDHYSGFDEDVVCKSSEHP